MPPPRHDALDVALGKAPAHVAANPKLTKPQADFFGSVAGVRSPINRQSSRVANPFATHVALGTGKPTVVDAATQLALDAGDLGQTPAQRLAKTIANDAKPAPGRKPLPLTPQTRKTVATAAPSGGRRARARARASEAAYAGPAPTTRQVPTAGRGGLGGTHGVEVAATAPSILSAAEKAQQLGIPLAALSTELQSKVRSALTSAALDPSYHYALPDLRSFTVAQKASVGLPATATDGDYIRAKFAPAMPHKSYLSGLMAHVPLNAEELAAAPFAIANATGDVLHQGVVGNLNSHPSDLFGAFQGNWTPAAELGKEFAKENIAYVKSLNPLHPHTLAGTIQKNPLTFATSFIGAGRVAGTAAGIAGRAGILDAGMSAVPGAIGRAGERGAARDFLTPKDRFVTPKGFETKDTDPDFIGPTPTPAINRGPSSPKLDERIAQAAADYLATKTHVFGDRLEAKRALNAKRESSRANDQSYREEVEPAVRAISALKRPIRRAVLFARGQGVTEEQLAQYFEKQRDAHLAAKPIHPDELAAQAEHVDAAGEPMHPGDYEGEPAPAVDPRHYQNELAHWTVIQRDLEKNATDWRGVADKVKGVETPQMTRALAAAVRASRAAEQHMKIQGPDGRPLVSDYSLIRRAYHPQATVKAALGDKDAQEWLDLDEEQQALQKKLKSADPSHHAAIMRQIETIRGEQWTKHEGLLGEVNKRIGQQQRVVETQRVHAARTPVYDTAAKILNRQGDIATPEAARLERMQGHAAEAFPVGDRIRPSELVAADKHLRLLDRKMRAAQNPATRRRLQAKIDEFTPIRDKMAAAPVGPEARQLRAQAARAGVETRTLDATRDAAAPVLPKAARLDEAQSRRMTREPERQLDKLLRQRDRLEAKRTLPADYSTARTRELEERATAADPQAIADHLAQVERETAEAFAKVRNAHRGVTKPNDFIGPQEHELADHAVTPLDEHDPLYFRHSQAEQGTLRRVIGGQGGGKLNLNARTTYEKGRLGGKDSPFSSSLLARGGVDTDPTRFFGPIAKPGRISAALRHLQMQVSQFSVRTHPGLQYDRRKWIRLDITQHGHEDIATKGARTSDELDRHIEETQSGDDHGFRDLFSHFDTRPQPNKELGTVSYDTIPDDGHEYVLVSRHAHAALQNDFLHGGIYSNPIFRKLQKGTQMWRWATLLARPAWLVSNFAGNTIQAATGGAGPLSFARAAMGRYKEDGVVPDRATNTGLYRHDLARPAAAGPASSALGKFGDMVANANVRFENYSRRALYLRHAIPEAKRRAIAAENRKIGTGFQRMNADVMEHLKQLGVEEQAAPHIVKVVNRWLGDFSRARNTPVTDLVAPFHRWFEFITRLVATMPVKTPGRALLLQRVGELGINMENQQNGGFTPNTMQGSFQMPGGLFKSTQALNPYATVFQLLDPNDDSSANPGWTGYRGITGALNPAIQDTFETLTGKSLYNGLGDLKDSHGNAAGALNPRVLLHDAENSIPLATALEGFNTADTSINPFDPQNRPKSGLAQGDVPDWMRAAGYFVGSVRNFDAKKNHTAGIKRLITTEKGIVKNVARHP